MKPFLLASLLLACGLSSCLSGPTYESIAAQLPPVPEHCGRIFCMRMLIEANIVRPMLLLNGEGIGRLEAGGFFFVDRPAGDYELTVAHPSANKVAVHLEAQQVCYVDTLVATKGFETAIQLWLAKPGDGELLLSDLKYTGPELPAPKPKP